MEHLVSCIRHCNRQNDSDYTQSEENFFLALEKVILDVNLDEEQRFQEAMAEHILSGMEQALMMIQARKTAQSHPHAYHNRK